MAWMSVSLSFPIACNLLSDSILKRSLYIEQFVVEAARPDVAVTFYSGLSNLSSFKLDLEGRNCPAVGKYFK